ncbi:MAG: tRNA uridine-5-carboxymethylaminomethyl(34) synthesis GTPase MnmE [Proteobacteria bacterium]|nr:tRNA uridine-5-carboxymethylaminomethyl(34) synthesis GTPase MnmE [Pseudomonadota bacterium]
MAKKYSFCAETIAAVASAPGLGGVGVVRISGRSLSDMAQQLCGKTPQARFATLVTFRDAHGQPIDQGILLYFPAPHSFTGEDVLELQGHGGPVVLQLLLQRCLELGARLAEPGEFTRRAFLNDKLDLAQAEALADLINAATAQAARSALRSLSGVFSQAVHGLVDQLITLRLTIEATLDFPEEEIEADEISRLGNQSNCLIQLRLDLAALLARARQGSLLRNGLTVVLAGSPNVGKSSLMNRLAGEERAIVTDIPGTTRDALRETIQVEGIPLHIIDTAGLREPVDLVERLGIERSWREIEKADVILQLVDARTGPGSEDAMIAERFPADLAGRRIMVHNKCDLAGISAGRRDENGQVHLFLSALTGDGVGLLHEQLLRLAGWHGHGEDAILARERHLQALNAAGVHLDQALVELQRSELCAEELRLAQEALNTITGEFTPDDLLGEIFSRFCIGK